MFSRARDQVATPDQLRTLVRFGLDQLRVRNAHHEFEHLCRHLARARVCSNIIPSTGPVSAGGDQGRDFESFRTYIENDGTDRSIFAGLASSARLAFACTLQSDDLERKIRDDVATICASGFPVSGVHVFMIGDLPTAKRHALQTWASDTHHLELELHDGNSIAELLVDPETFWIASRYLEIPSEHCPDRTGSAWYEELATRVRGQPQTCATDGTFFELKRLVRHATASKKLASDLPEFIARLMTVDESDRRLWRAAMYEVFVASLRGLRTLEGFEDQIRRYFADAEATTSAADLRDASCLLGYCTDARAMHVLNLDAESLTTWRAHLIDRVDSLLSETTSASTRCALLDVRWYLALSPWPGAKARPPLDDAFPWLERLTENVTAAKLFPLANLIDNLTQFQAMLRVDDTRRYQELTTRLDTVLAEREGEQAVAKKLCARAIAFQKARRPLVALKFIHDANIKWFAHETLHGSLLAQLLLADIYDSLGLSKAAQYFALGEAYLALNSDVPGIRALASRGLFAAAKYAYHAGEWFRFLDFGEAALRVHARFTPDPGNLDVHAGFSELAFGSAGILVLLEQLDAPALSQVQPRIEKWGLDWLLDGMLAAARSGHGKLTLDETWAQLEGQLRGRPLSDAGRTRRLHWRALGVRWRFRWLNRPPTVAVAEQLVACLQVVLADLAEEDLCLLPATVTVRVRVGPLNVIQEPSNRGSRWTVTIPADLSIDDAVAATIGVVSALLHDVSTLRSKVFMGVVEERFKAGLSSKVFIARPYSELFATFVPSSGVLAAKRVAPALVGRRFRLRQHRTLAWKSTLGPFYPAADIQTWLTNRYTRLLPPISSTLAALRADRNFQVILAALRESRWRDWHVLNAIYSIAFNERARVAGARTPEQLHRFREGFDLMRVSAPDDVRLFSERRLREAQFLNMLSTLKILGHEVHQETPAFKAIERFLASRYRYFHDDVEHDDPFCPP